MKTREELWEIAESLVDELEEIVGQHSSMIHGDDQYDDPELWWAEPALEYAKKLRNVL